MNVSAPPPPASSPPQSSANATGQREIHPNRARAHADDRGRFERLMHQKSATDDDSEDASADTSRDNEGAPGGLLSAFPPPSFALSSHRGLGGLEAAGPSAGSAGAAASA